VRFAKEKVAVGQVWKVEGSRSCSTASFCISGAELSGCYQVLVCYCRQLRDVLWFQAFFTKRKKNVLCGDHGSQTRGSTLLLHVHMSYCIELKVKVSSSLCIP
jgi:hypothetical protein